MIKKIKLLYRLFLIIKSFKSKADISILIGDVIRELLVYVGKSSDNAKHYKYFVKDRDSKLKAGLASNKNTPVFSFIQEDYNEVISFVTFSRNLMISDKSDKIIKK